MNISCPSHIFCSFSTSTYQNRKLKKRGSCNPDWGCYCDLCEFTCFAAQTEELHASFDIPGRNMPASWRRGAHPSSAMMEAVALQLAGCSVPSYVMIAVCVELGLHGVCV